MEISLRARYVRRFQFVIPSYFSQLKLIKRHIGREFDMYGNLHQWWNNATTDRFKNRTECFVEQYNQYQVHGRNINGRQTLGKNIYYLIFLLYTYVHIYIYFFFWRRNIRVLKIDCNAGENIADNGGLKAAYHAYISMPKYYKDLLQLPGVNMTQNQLFFLNFAQVRRQVYA